MKPENITLEETGCFSSTFTKYLNGEKSLEEFYGLVPTIENFEQQIKEKQLPKSNREVLSATLQSQYEGLDISKLTADNIQLLKEENTYTVTTGHQLNICTGPLYFIYKIVTVINICKKLKAKYSDKNFVPVYWMATEDHDLEEINHFFLFGEKVQWETDQTGAVGRMDTKSLENIFAKLPEKAGFFQKAYQESDCLADAVRRYVNDLFGDQGLVVIDADSKELKQQFAEVIQDDILNNKANQLVESTSSKLNEAGFKTQVFPREINFFYLENDTRNRLVKKGDGYQVKNTNQTFSQEEIIELVKSEPKRFSPNVILRPLYQETILPNLAYIGGPAEVVYWLQLKAVFDHYKTPFPILMPRNFGLIIPKHILRKFNKVGLSIKQLFQPVEDIKKEFILEHSDLDLELKKEIDHLKAVYDTVKEKAAQVDKSLEGMVGAEESKTLKGLENIEKRMKKSEERNQDVGIQQIESVKNALFPDGNLQERHDNFLNFYVNNDNLISDLLDSFDPFSYTFHILKEEEVPETTPAN